jgi:hypothetical protein
MVRKRRPTWLIALSIILALFVAYYVVGEVFQRNPPSAGDSEDAVVQPARTPPPGGEPRLTAPSADASANRGESAVRGDGQPLNGSTAAPGVE